MLPFVFLTMALGELNPLATEWKPEMGDKIRDAQANALHRSAPETPASPQRVIGPEHLLGTWADSLGNSVLVFSVDAYAVRLVATLSQPPRKDITLKLKQSVDGGWMCGNAKLDLSWSTAVQLHWLTADGRISVWVRPQPGGSN